MKIGQLLNTKEPLQKLLNQELPVRVSYKLAKMIKKVEQELVAFEEVRQKLVQKYGENQQDGSVNVTINNRATFQSEYSELVNQEVESDLPKVSVSDLEKISMTPGEMIAIEYLLEDDEK